MTMVEAINALPDPEGRFCFHVWPDGCAVFDRLTGDTHLLDVFSAGLFLSAVQTQGTELGKLSMPDLSPERLADANEEARGRLKTLKLPVPF